MGELASVDKAKRELEELYLGVPDDSVNLTFQDLAQLMGEKHPAVALFPQSSNFNADHTNANTMLKIDKPIHTLTKLPSLDFNRALEASAHYPTHNHNHRYSNPSAQQNHLGQLVAELDSLDEDPMLHGSSTHHNHNDYDRHGGEIHAHHAIDGHFSHHHLHHDHKHIRYGHGGEAHGTHAIDGPVCHQHHASPYHDSTACHAYDKNDTMSHTSGMTSTSMSAATTPYQERQRPGIPHSNICTVCTTYIYIFRHRCLVCGRVYCRQCVRIGMGDMSEGRKCVECLGRRFSQRYIQRAGQIGCCMGYPSTTKQQELKWAEKGPRRSGESRPGRSNAGSKLRSPAPRTPPRTHSPSPTPSFVMDSPYSPYTPTRHHPLPL